MAVEIGVTKNEVLSSLFWEVDMFLFNRPVGSSGETVDDTLSLFLSLEINLSFRTVMEADAAIV